jgi:hypothetical protein
MESSKRRIEKYCENCGEKYTYTEKEAKSEGWLKRYCTYECFIIDQGDDSTHLRVPKFS